MSAAVDAERLPAILTDADLVLDFELYGETTSDPLDLTGSTFSLVIAPRRRQPAAADVHELTSAGGEIAVAGHVVSVRAPAADVATWAPGDYVVELRRTSGPQIEAVYMAEVAVVRGLSQAADAGDASPLPPGGLGGVTILQGIRVIRGAGAGAVAAAQAAADLAERYATKTDDEVEAGTHSAKAWAIGGTGDGQPAEGAAKDWATRVGAPVVGAFFSAIEWAIGAATRGLAGGGSAKDWATYVDGTVDDAGYSARAHAEGSTPTGSAKDWATKTASAVAGGLYGALKYAQDAAASAAAAAGSLADAIVQAALATTKAGEASASANAAATSAASVASQDVANAFAIEERVAIYDPAATAAQRLATVRRGVENRPAASSGASYFRRGLVAFTALTGVATVTRATTAWGYDQSRVLSAFAAGAPVVTNAGHAIYESRINSIRNPTAAGAAAGTPGTLPTNWTATGSTGLAQQVVGTGTQNGIPYVDIRFSGTVSTVTTISLSADTRTFAAAAVGETWTAHATLSLVGGSFANVSSAAFNLYEVDSGAAALVNSTTSILTLDSTPRDVRVSRAFNQATAASAWSQIGIAPASVGAAVDFTLRIAGWNLKKGVDLNDPPILQAGASGTGARNADVAQETVDIPVGQAFTVTGKFIAPPLAGMASGATVFQINEAAGNTERLVLQMASGVIYVGVRAKGIGNASLTTVSITPGAPVGFAVSVSGSSVSLSINGAAAVTGLNPGGAYSQALTRLFLGCTDGGGQQLNSTLRELLIHDRAFSAAELATASDVSLEWDLDFTTQTYRYLGQAYTSPTELPGTTFTRATVAKVVSLAGCLIDVGSGALRVIDAGLTIEPARTNKCTNTNVNPANLTNMGSGGDAAAVMSVVTDAAELAKIGLTGNVFKIDNTLGTTPAWLTPTGTPGNTNNHSLSAYVRGGTGSLRFNTGGVSVAFPASTSYVRRFNDNCAVTGAANTFQIRADAGQVVYFILNQMEEGMFSTSPIPVAGATATRNADVLVTTETNPASYTLFAEFDCPPFVSGSYRTVLMVTNPATGADWVQLYIAPDGNLTARVRVGGVDQANLNLGPTVAGTRYRIAVRVAPNDFAATVNGAAVVTDVSGTVPATTAVQVGNNPNDATQFFGPGIRKVRRWRGGRTNAQLLADAA